MKRVAVALVVALAMAVAIVAVAGGIALRGGISTRPEPSGAEAALARHIRHLAIPASARALPNPVPLTSAAIAQGRAHFADHCASCHGNDGRGRTELGVRSTPALRT